jgi:hypothetical protein
VQRYPNLYHPGPATAWLSKAPGNLDEYVGDGEWFKILSVVGRTTQSVPPNDDMVWKHQWGTYQATNVRNLVYTMKQFANILMIVDFRYSSTHTGRELLVEIRTCVSAAGQFAVRILSYSCDR